MKKYLVLILVFITAILLFKCDKIEIDEEITTPEYNYRIS